ncbi:MAG TPA: YCF48-related protein [Candidatus Angelobacter sp.]|nr:YCF48-related protein [Candidatus Angelobacter sp.]
MPELPNLLRQRLAGTKNGPAPVQPQATAHPDADTLTAYVEKSLPATERQTVIAHLSVCEPCREVVVLSQSELPELATQTVLAPAPVSPWRRLLRPAFSLAASVAAMAIIAVVVLRLPQKPAQQAANPTATEAKQAQGTPVKDQVAVPEQPQAAAPAPSANIPSTLVARSDFDRNAKESRAQMKREVPAGARTAGTFGAASSMAPPPPPPKVPGLTAGLQKKDYVNTDFFAANNADKVVLDSQNRNDLPSAPQPQTAAAGTLFSANTKITGFSDIPANAAGNSNVRILTPNPPSKPLSYKLGQLASATVRGLRLHTNVAPALRSGALGASTMGEPGSFSATLLKNQTAEVKAAPEKADAGSLAASDALSPGALSAPGFRSGESTPASWKVVGGKLIKSAGQSQWEEAYPGAGFEFSVVTARGNDVWAGGSHASIIHSRDGGQTWETVRLGEAATGSIVSIMAGTLNVQVRTSDNQLWSSTDAGKTWSLRGE